MTRMLTGERPTGPLHIGHLFGTVANRVRLQRSGVETLLVLADYQVITDREVTGDVASNVHEIVLDYLAAGIDPDDPATIFTHSAVPALHQLMLPFLSLVSVAELERNPTVKQELADSGRSMSGLLLTYPVHQAADILFCHADVVPVGRDQLPHLELTRTIARRFTQRYGPCFTEPEAAAVRGPGGAGHRRPQDEQEHGQRHRAAGERRRDGPRDPVREDRLRPGDHLRPVVATRGGQPAPARVAVHGRRRRRRSPTRSGPAARAASRRSSPTRSSSTWLPCAPVAPCSPRSPGWWPTSWRRGTHARTSSRTPRSVTSASSWG